MSDDRLLTAAIAQRGSVATVGPMLHTPCCETCVVIGDSYEFDDDPSRVDLDALWQFLHTSAYWGRWRTRDVVEHQLRSAWRVVGCYAPHGAMVGYARAVSDGCSIAYLADVYVLPEHRGQGLGRRLVATMIEDGDGSGFRWMLHTSDAHGLYASFGFAPPDVTYMERPRP